VGAAAAVGAGAAVGAAAAGALVAAGASGVAPPQAANSAAPALANVARKNVRLESLGVVSSRSIACTPSFQQDHLWNMWLYLGIMLLYHDFVNVDQHWIHLWVQANKLPD
jgi:hypothetical protein